jgi:hypothetical protein
VMKQNAEHDKEFSFSNKLFEKNPS